MYNLNIMGILAKKNFFFNSFRSNKFWIKKLIFLQSIHCFSLLYIYVFIKKKTPSNSLNEKRKSLQFEPTPTKKCSNSISWHDTYNASQICTCINDNSSLWKINSTQWKHLYKKVFAKCFLCGHLGACPLHVTLFLMVPFTSPDHV